MLTLIHPGTGMRLETPTRFPNQELNIPKWVYNTGSVDHVDVTFYYKTDADLVELLMFSQVAINSGKTLDLTIAYMPYSRMDRDHVGGSNCPLRYIGAMIQSVGFASITVVDPHSEATLAFLGPKAKQVYPFKEHLSNYILVHKSYEEWKDVVIMFPDAGAQKRYSSMPCFKDYRHVVGIKKRDFTTGQIVSFTLTDPDLVKGRDVVIVDDLCSYGGTFLKSGQALKAAGANRVDLLVSHCEPSVYDGKLLDPDSPVDGIWTTTSILEIQLGRVTAHHLGGLTI